MAISPTAVVGPCCDTWEMVLHLRTSLNLAAQEHSSDLLDNFMFRPDNVHHPPPCHYVLHWPVMFSARDREQRKPRNGFPRVVQLKTFPFDVSLV